MIKNGGGAKAAMVSATFAVEDVGLPGAATPSMYTQRARKRLQRSGRVESPSINVFVRVTNKIHDPGWKSLRVMPHAQVSESETQLGTTSSGADTGESGKGLVVTFFLPFFFHPLYAGPKRLFNRNAAALLPRSHS